MRPETNTSNLVERLQALAQSATKPDDISAATLRKEIKEIFAIDPSQGYMLDGIYYCLFDDCTKSIDSHKKALRLCSDSVIYTNYLTSLLTLGEISKAYDLAVEAVNYHPDDIGLTSYAARISFEAGKLNEVIKFHKTYEKLTVNQESIQSNKLTSAVNSATKLLEQGLDADEMSKVIAVSEAILLDNNIKSNATKIFTHEGDFSYIIETNTTAETAVKLNNELFDRLASLKDFIAYNFTLVFAPAVLE
jgi:tetratricopeptide (TPR) repeat protein